MSFMKQFQILNYKTLFEIRNNSSTKNICNQKSISCMHYTFTVICIFKRIKNCLCLIIYNKELLHFLTLIIFEQCF